MNIKLFDNLKTVLLFLAIIIMIILALHFTYNKYLKDTMLTDGKILCNQIMNAQMAYYSENKKFMSLDKVSYVEELPLDARNNPYFSVFSTYQINEKKQGITVFGSEEMEGYEIHLEFDDKAKIRSIKNLKMEVFKNKLKTQ
ncbi:MAG: hypothetical protein VB017_00690 [Endomicrobiaceae bacterium]|nr:hypothetical protein [Endomicrobiaceae bacterium]